MELSTYLTTESKTRLLDPTNPARTISHEIEGYQIIDLIGVEEIVNKPLTEQVQVSIVTITGPYQERGHTHQSATTLIEHVSGRGTFTIEAREVEMKPGVRVLIPAGVPHGSSVAEGERLVLLSVQNPPIRNPLTGEFDFQPAPN